MNSTEVLDLIELVEGEVNNGGFHQFFFNSSGDKTAETIDALEIVGAPLMADILRRAASRFPEGMPPRDREERSTILETVFPETDEFDDLDAEFWAYPEDLAALVEAYKNRP